jgi:hypothetical protein
MEGARSITPSSF